MKAREVVAALLAPNVRGHFTVKVKRLSHFHDDVVTRIEIDLINESVTIVVGPNGSRHGAA